MSTIKQGRARKRGRRVKKKLVISETRRLRNARVIDLMTLDSDSDSKAKSDDSDSSHDSKSLDSGLGYIRVKIGHISPQFWSF